MHFCAILVIYFEAAKQNRGKVNEIIYYLAMLCVSLLSSIFSSLIKGFI